MLYLMPLLFFASRRLHFTNFHAASHPSFVKYDTSPRPRDRKPFLILYGAKQIEKYCHFSRTTYFRA